MGFIISNKIWQLTEKLYIHCYKLDGFVSFLESYEIIFPNNFYNTFEIYSFMSIEQNRFSHFMQRVPFYKCISILEKIVFDERIKNTQQDNWDYYGIAVNTWYPELIKEIKKVHLEINITDQKIICIENRREEVQSSFDFLNFNFNDPFLEYIKKEINENSKDGRFLSVMVLCRKLIECILVRIFEVVFIKSNPDGSYNENNHVLWFDKSKNRIHGLDILIENLKNNSLRFQEDKEFVEDLCFLIKPLKNEINKIVHRDYKTPSNDDVNKWEIPGLTNRLGRLYRKYCNP